MLQINCKKFSQLILVSLFLLISLLYSTGHAGTWQPAHTLDAKSCPNPILVQVNSSTNELVSLNYNVPEPTFVRQYTQVYKSRNTEIFLCGNAERYGNEGEPIIPFIPVKFILPFGKTIDRIIVDRGQEIVLQGNHFLEYGEKDYPLLPDINVENAVPENEIYGSDNPFPAQSYELISIQRKCGVAIAYINLFPAVYYPKSGTVAYFKNPKVEILLKPDYAVNNLDIRISPREVSQSKLRIENSGALSTYPEGVIPNRKRLTICDPREDFAYLFITNQTLLSDASNPSVNDMIEHRKSKGLTAKAVTMEEIISSSTGKDKQEKLRNFIKEAYNNWKTKWVVLAGDTAVVPCRSLYDGSTAIASDIYFQCLDGTMDNDGDGKYGEKTDGEGGQDIDFVAEVYIGRMSAGSANELSNQLFKILAYEKDNSSEQYLKTALMIGEKLGFGGVSEYATANMEEIRLGSSTNGYTTKGFAESSEYTVKTMYDSPTYTWTKQNLIDSINSNKYSIFNHLGHSSTTMNSKLNNGDETKMTNTKFIFHTSQGCYPGDFEKDCVGERLTTQTRTGFWGGVFNDRYGYGANNSTDGPSQRIQRHFWHAFFAESMDNVGMLSEYSHQKCVQYFSKYNVRYCVLETNYFGDPHTIMRGKGPSVPFISITTPNGGEQWEVGTAQAIRWSDNIDGNVKIDLLKGGSFITTLINSTPSNGTYQWNIPGNIAEGSDYKIKITSVDSTALFDESDNNFMIMLEYYLNVPYTQTFDTLDTGEIVLPYKWEQSSGDDMDWIVWQGPTPTRKGSTTPRTGAAADHTSGSTKYIYVEATNNTPNKKASYTTPKFRLNNVTNPTLTFWYHMFSSDNTMGKLNLDICVDGAWKDSVVQINGNKGDQWVQQSVNLNTYIGDRVIFRFRAATGTSSYSDICIDDFRIDGQVPVTNVINTLPSSYGIKCYGSRVHFAVPANNLTSPIKITLYNAQGKLINTLVNEKMKPGFYSMPLNKMAAGLYLVTMEAKGFKNTITLALTK